jgi:hypothetical protein
MVTEHCLEGDPSCGFALIAPLHIGDIDEVSPG